MIRLQITNKYIYIFFKSFNISLILFEDKVEYIKLDCILLGFEIRKH